MIAALLIYAGAAGIAIVEGLRRAMAAIGVAPRLTQLQDLLRAFRAAEDDDTRQRLILQAGLRTLALSFLLFASLAVACLVMLLPLPWVPTTTATMTAYMVVLSVAAVAWWRLR